MKKEIICLFFFSYYVLANRSDKILIVNDNTFNKTVKIYSPIIVEFTADPCEHCGEVDAVFKQIWRKNKAMNLPITFVKINITRNNQIKERFNITQYPELKLFKDGELFENYNNSPTDKDIINWLKKRLNPLVTEISSLIKIHHSIRTNENSLLFFGNKTNEMYEIFSNISSEFLYIDFISSEVKEIGPHYNINEGSLILFQKFSEKEIIISEKLGSLQHLSRIIKTKFLDNLKRFNSDVNKMVFNLGSPGLFLYRDEKHFYTRHYDVIMEEIAIKNKVNIYHK